ncbi:MAG: exosortase-associated EpsI family protein [Planctomycetes bacterium]|nr:exosortase-associated EpsI family protein [Planctomycetota bacterium]
MRKYSPALLLSLVLLFSGFVHGSWTGRWAQSEALTHAAARVDTAPEQIGVWTGQDQVLDPRQASQAGVVAYTLRRFASPQENGSFTVLLMCGRSGPMAVHSPDVCYRGAGFVLAGEPARRAIALETEGGNAEFFVGNFRRSDAAGTHQLRIFWTWLGNDEWQAPDHPRAAFAVRPALYKLYVIREPAYGDAKLEETACDRFLQQLLPALNHALLSTPLLSPPLPSTPNSPRTED